jgi:hypothetical protein
MLVDHITITLSPNSALPDKRIAVGKDHKNKNKIQNRGTASGKIKEKPGLEITDPEGNRRLAKQTKFGAYRQKSRQRPGITPTTQDTDRVSGILDQAQSKHTGVKTRLRPGTLWLSPGRAPAHFGKDQAESRHTLEKTRPRPGTLWISPDKLLAHFGKDQAKSRHTLEKTRRSPGTLWKRPNKVWHIQGPETFWFKLSKATQWLKKRTKQIQHTCT